MAKVMTFKLTNERYKELEDELNYLKTVREKEVAEQIKEARSFGDLSENSEYDEAKNEQGKVYSRIAELENILNHAQVISEDEISTDMVAPGCKVEVRDVQSGDKDVYHIVGSQEANPAQFRISDESPFGKALIGKKAGEHAVVDAPAGKLHFEIVEILK